ncbi:MAG: hypothetical protein ACR2GU_13340 [Rubrobacteraceae bacterium]
MAVIQKPATAEELLKIPDDGLRSEFVRGEGLRMEPAGNVLDGGSVTPGWKLSVDEVFR